MSSKKAVSPRKTGDGAAAEASDLAHRSYQPYKPAANKKLAKKWDETNYNRHRERVRSVKASVDNKPPKTYMHLHLKLKKLQMEEERLATIERDNRLLLEKMSTIMQTKGSVDNQNDYDHKSLNKERRQRELLRITHENQAILKRISAKQGELNPQEWEDEYATKQYYKKQITRFPQDPNQSPRKKAAASPPPPVAAAAAASPPPQKAASPTKTASPPPKKAASPKKTETKKEETPATAEAEEAEPAVEPKEDLQWPFAGDAADRPTIKADSFGSYDASEASTKLREAMKGMGTNEDKIFEVVSSASQQQRVDTIPVYTSSIKRDLLKDLQSELGGDFKKVVIAMFTPLREFETDIVRNAIKGMGTNEMAVTEVLCGSDNAAIAEIRELYKTLHSKELVADVRGDFKGFAQTALVAIAEGQRKESDDCDDKVAADQAKVLAASADKWKKDEESTLFKFLLDASTGQLNAVSKAYYAQTGYDILTHIDSKLKGDDGAVARAMLLSARNKYAFHAERLFKSMKGLGTDEDALSRGIVRRAEIDLGTIMDTFNAKYKETEKMDLVEFIKDETSGDYLKTLLWLLGQS